MSKAVLVEGLWSELDHTNEFIKASLVEKSKCVVLTVLLLARDSLIQK